MNTRTASQETLKAFFDNSADIDSVVAKLVAAGIPRSSISVRGGHAVGVEVPKTLYGKALAILDDAGGLAGTEGD